MNTKDLSVIILAKNEEKRIEECIASVSWAGEVIVIDNGSTDATTAIAKKLKAIVYIDTARDFSKLRSIGKEKASGNWLLYIDADEIITRELQQEILKRIQDDNSYAAYYITRQNTYLGYPWPTKDKMVRLIKKQSLYAWKGSLHEHPEIHGEVGELKSSLCHNTHRTIEEMVSKTNEWSEVEANLRYQSHHPIMKQWRFLRVMMTAFLKSFIQERGWKAGTVGLIESIYQSFSMFITYAKLWEKQQQK